MTAEQLTQYFYLHSSKLQNCALAMAYNLGLSHEFAEDAVQESFMKLSQAFDQKERIEADGIYFWLRTTMRNYLINVRKRETKIRHRFEDRRFAFSEPMMMDDKFSLETDEDIERVKVWLKKLDPERSQVVYLRIFENLSTKETAKILNVEEGTVKSRLNRSLKSLKDYMG